MLGATHTHAHEPIARPSHAIAFQNTVQFGGRYPGWISATPEGLTPQRFGQFGTLRALFDTPNHLAQRFNLAFGFKSWVARWIVVIAELFAHAAVAHPYDITGGQVHQTGAIAFAHEVQ